MLELAEQLADVMPTALEGSVVQTVGLTAAVADFPAPVGALVEIDRQGGAALEAEVIGFRDGVTLLYPLSDMQGVRHGNRVRLVRTKNWLRVGPGLLGRVIDARGRCIDALPARSPKN
jgi:flagellar biosynthesis/type III secretory pathway ATPase